MQQLFAPKIRRKYNVSQLITLDAHQACNSAYQDDEDYFVRTLTPFARGSEAGNAIYAKVLGDFRTGKQVPLTKMVLEEFDPNPSGLLLPGGKVVKRFQGERLRRVAWKIVRGLHFYHNNEVLPENWKSVGVQIYAGETPRPDDVRCFVAITPSRGTYPGALWDRIIVGVTFHDPALHLSDVRNLGGSRSRR